MDWNRVRAALFDVDGTLIDSNAAHTESWLRALEEHGVQVDRSRLRALIGKGADKLLPEVAGVAEHSGRGRLIAGRKAEIFGALLPTLAGTEGARALLEFLKSRRITVGVATSGSDEDVNNLLKQAGLDDLVRARATRDDGRQSKPDPDIVQASLRKTSVSAADAVLIGDTPYDIESAQAAGVRAVALRCGGFWGDEAFANAEAIYDDPRGLLSALTSRDRESGAA